MDDRLRGIPQGLADTARAGVANAVEVARSAGPHAQDLVHAARQSFVDGWQQAMWAGVAVMGALFVYIALRGPKTPPPRLPHGPIQSRTASASTSTSTSGSKR
ncbi:hypothetical protein ACFSTC_10340 [Nonomuraea ferruginea]